MVGKVGMKTSKLTELPQWTDNFLSLIDQRSSLAVLLRRRLESLEWDLSGGEPERLDYLTRSRIRRFLWLERYIELQEARLATDEPPSAGAYGSLLNSFTNLARQLRVNVNVKRLPTFHEYIDQEADK